MGTKSRRNQVSWLIAGSSGRRKRGSREGRHCARERVQGWSAEAVGLTQAVPIPPPTRPFFGGGGKGRKKEGGVRG